MGIHTISSSKRNQPFLDVSLLHSKTGDAILRGSSFYDRTLDFQVSHFNKDACVSARSIEYQKKQVVNRRRRIMNRSEKLVQVYNLPPLKSSDHKPLASKSKTTNVPETATSLVAGEKHQRSYLLKERHRSQSGGEMHRLENSVIFDTTTSIRGTMSSPAPQELVDDPLDHSGYLKHKESSGFPAITVQKCDESRPSPRTSRKQTISDDMRTLSANNLYVPSLQRPGRMELEECNMSTLPDNLSRSEGSLNRSLGRSAPEKGNKSMPFSAPVTRPTIRSSYDIAAEEFRRNREMYSPSTPRRPVRLIALTEKSRSHSAGDVHNKRQL
ncbi:hypothetical protein SNE40_001824 [Patella caerulea]|uniref:Uncharacterized protein n=1 Tax=Patella caerulea TaxID=87958 RepID=A0AAN8K3S5_PATCE